MKHTIKFKTLNIRNLNKTTLGVGLLVLLLPAFLIAAKTNTIFKHQASGAGYCSPTVDANGNCTVAGYHEDGGFCPNGGIHCSCGGSTDNITGVPSDARGAECIPGQHTCGAGLTCKASGPDFDHCVSYEVPQGQPCGNFHYCSGGLTCTNGICGGGGSSSISPDPSCYQYSGVGRISNCTAHAAQGCVWYACNNICDSVGKTYCSSTSQNQTETKNPVYSTPTPTPYMLPGSACPAGTACVPNDGHTCNSWMNGYCDAGSGPNSGLCCDANVPHTVIQGDTSNINGTNTYNTGKGTTTTCPAGEHYPHYQMNYNYAPAVCASFTSCGIDSCDPNAGSTNTQSSPYSTIAPSPQTYYEGQGQFCNGINFLCNAPYTCFNNKCQ